MFKKVLVALDGSEVAEEVLPHVEDIGTQSNPEVVLLAIVVPQLKVLEAGVRTIATIDQELEVARAELDRYLSQVASHLQARGLVVRLVVKFGHPAEEILSYAKNNDIDLIAMCTHGRSGIGRWVYGSVADQVLRAATTPVLLIRWSGAKHE